MRTWLEEYNYWRAGQTRGFVLTGNTSDKQYLPDLAPIPMPLKYFLSALQAKEGYSTGGFTIAHGFEEIEPPPGSRARRPSPFAPLPNSQDPVALLHGLTQILRDPHSKICLILDYAEHIAPSSSGMTAMFGQQQLAMLELLHGWGKDDAIRRTENLVILVTYGEGVNELLLNAGSGFRQIDLPLPNETQRKQFIGDCTTKTEGFEDWSATSLGTDDLARQSSGLPLVAIDELFKLSVRNQRPLDMEMLRTVKGRTIGQLCGKLLEVKETCGGFATVGGLEYAKEELLRTMVSFRTNPGTAPQGILFVGVPGCGKSFLVEAMAHELSLPCLVMRNIREGLVGASERNLERVLNVIETLSPCVLLIDEIDQVMGQRNTGQSMDAGTSERMMGRVLEFFGSLRYRGRVLVVGTSNRPDALDAALLDRFQLVVPFLHPTPSEMQALLPMLASQLGHTLADGAAIDAFEILEVLKFPTIRGLQEIVARGASFSCNNSAENSPAIDAEHLRVAALDYQPAHDPLQHEFIALCAIGMTSFASILPWRNKHGIRPDAHIPEYLRPVLTEDGRVDSRRLQDKKAEVAALLYARRTMAQF